MSEKPKRDGTDGRHGTYESHSSHVSHPLLPPKGNYQRQVGRKTPQTFDLYREVIDTRPPGIVANIAIGLIHQTNYLLDRQLRRLEQDFLNEGGLRERMTRARLQHRAGRSNDVR